MMIKITERCTMGCIHCMNRAEPGGRDMDMKHFMDVLEFLRDNNLGRQVIVITGGEPTEHREFDRIMSCLIEFSRGYRCFSNVIVTTNGELISKDFSRFQGYIEKSKGIFKLMYQVSADERYYPRRIPIHKRVFREEGFVLCDNCVEQVYPQGRALDNNIPWKARASKCFNVRALSKQMENCSLNEIEIFMMLKGKMCTPHISIDGDIKLGESDLCPPCASIYDEYDDIIEKIRTFKCNKCDHINKNLEDKYKQFL